MVISFYFVHDQLMGIHNMNRASVGSTDITTHERKRERRKIIWGGNTNIWRIAG